jgi:hypothetical protein
MKLHVGGPWVRNERALRIFADVCPLFLGYWSYCFIFHSSFLPFVLSFCVPPILLVCPHSLISLYLPFFAVYPLSQFTPPPPPFTQMLRISRAPVILKFALERNYLVRRHCSALRLIELPGRGT